MSPVDVRFNVICGPGTDEDVTIHRAPMAAVPASGDVISVLGNPYVVVDRGWAAANDETYCYLRISNLYVHADAVLDKRRYTVKRVKEKAS